MNPSTPEKRTASDPTGFAAVIVAAGSGTRFGGPKHLLTIGGRTLWKRCVDAFEAAGVELVVVVGDVPGGVPGGDRRRDSVEAGLAAASEAEWVLIHDAARPLITVDLIIRVMDAARVGGIDGVIPVVPVTDTIKRVVDDTVVETVDRSQLVATQTPQAFRLASLVQAHLVDPEVDVTDDAGLVERAGGTVTVVRGDPHNLKITVPDDLERARIIAREWGE